MLQTRYFHHGLLEESKRNMEGLRDIIVHLEEKTSAMRYASTG